MNASEVLKGFAMKQVYSYLDRDPEANLPNLLDMLEKYDKNGQAVTTQVEGIRAALSDPNNNWSKLACGRTLTTNSAKNWWRPLSSTAR